MRANFLFPIESINYLDILHVDIQGAEADMLKGAQKSLSAKNIGFIFISTHSKKLHQHCLDFLLASNYGIVAEHTSDESYSTDGLIVACSKNRNFKQVSISKRRDLSKHIYSKLKKIYRKLKDLFLGYHRLLDGIKRIDRKINKWRYSQYAKNAARPHFPVAPEYIKLSYQLRADGYYSQNGQDKWLVENLFPMKTDGVFVDVGAHDGISFSNTYLLEQKGWKGIAVEPNPFVYEKLSQNRKCVTVQGCIAEKAGIAKFRMVTGYSEMLSGLVAEYEPLHIERVQKEIEQHGGKYEDIEVNCYSLVELLKSQDIHNVDYLSIDVEGAEFSILKSINFNTIRIAVISIENNYRDLRIPRFLTRRGYTLRAIVGDEFYVLAR